MFVCFIAKNNNNGNNKKQFGLCFVQFFPDKKESCGKSERKPKKNDNEQQ